MGGNKPPTRLRRMWAMLFCDDTSKNFIHMVLAAAANSADIMWLTNFQVEFIHLYIYTQYIFQSGMRDWTTLTIHLYVLVGRQLHTPSTREQRWCFYECYSPLDNDFIVGFGPAVTVCECKWRKINTNNISPVLLCHDAIYYMYKFFRELRNDDEIPLERNISLLLWKTHLNRPTWQFYFKEINIHH